MTPRDSALPDTGYPTSMQELLRRWPLCAALLVLTGCDARGIGAEPHPPRAERVAAPALPAGAEWTPREVSSAAGTFVVDTVARGLEVPWGMDFAPDGRLFLTERPGRIRVVENGRLRPEPWAELDVHATDESFWPESGLMGIAVAPDFAETGHVYVLGTFWRGDWARSTSVAARGLRRGLDVVAPARAHRWENRVYRLTDRGGRGTRPELVVRGLPASHYHAGGALAFGPDGMLYVSVGDGTRPEVAQEIGSPAGKILRYRPDGGVPHDNPFPGSPVYALGLRNPQGLAWHPRAGALLAVEHGPTAMAQEDRRFGRDELNLIVPGGNYGWPVVAGAEDDDRFDAPLVEWTRAIAPSGLAVYSGDAFPWQGDLFVGALRGRQLRRVVLGPAQAPGGLRAIHEEPLLEEALGRIRAVRAGPDGYLYFTTSNRDGRGVPGGGDDRLLRLVPRPAAGGGAMAEAVRPGREPRD
jgi:aldose sugar dehydrogenase